MLPASLGTSKPLLPIYDKPLIYYAISSLMVSGIQELIVITSPSDQESYRRLLGDGQRFGIQITYMVQKIQRGIADAFLVAEKEIKNSEVALVLGDNLFNGLESVIKVENISTLVGAQIFAYRVSDPKRFGIVDFDLNGKVLSIEEKPLNPKSSYAIPGLYFYDSQVVDIVKTLSPSARGELEITDVNKVYLSQGNLNVTVLPRGTAWLDTGTFTSMHDASSYVRAVEEREGYKIACLEEIAFKNGWISLDQLVEISDEFKNSPYGDYLKMVAKGI